MDGRCLQKGLVSVSCWTCIGRGQVFIAANAGRRRGGVGLYLERKEVGAAQMRRIIRSSAR